MALFVETTNTQAFVKAGFMGFQGSGKTYTASEFAKGLILLGRARQLPFGDQPLLFFDTETGSDWVRPQMAEAGIKLLAAKTRAFSEILVGIDEAETMGAVLLVDSLTHVWRDLCDSYKKKRNRRRLEFQDWDVLKGEWATFTDRFVNACCHIVLCGRAGYEYDQFEDEDGKKQIEKTGIKMKAENETGYEPSLLVLMERRLRVPEHDEEGGGRGRKRKTKPDLHNVVRVAHVMKDRSARIDGREFEQPRFEDFLPHVEAINLGGRHLGVDTSRTSEDRFEPDGEVKWMRERRDRDIALDEIKEELVRAWPGRTDAAVKAKADCLEAVFGTRSWEAVQSWRLADLKPARNALWMRLRGHEYGYVPEGKERAPVPSEFPPLPKEL